MLIEANERVEKYSLSDEELCFLSKNDDMEAEEILAERYHRLVRSIAHSFFLVGGDSEDLLQEGMLGLINAIREYNPEKEVRFSTFADTCIRNRIINIIKSAASGKHTPLNKAIPLDSAYIDETPQLDPEDLVIDNEKATDLLEVIFKSLSPLESNILRYYLSGLSCKEISLQINKPLKSVDNAIQRIRKKVSRTINFGDISNH